MNYITEIAQTVAIISACWTIISGVGAWKREFIGKRRIELAEEVLATFFQIKDSIAQIRNPFSNTTEGKSRQKNEHESAIESQLLDRGFTVFERYEKNKECFIKFNTLKYRFMATFGHNSEEVFTETLHILNRIFVAAEMLSTHYWKRQGNVEMEPAEFQQHLDDMRREEKIFWEYSKDDEINTQLIEIQKKLELITKPCFEEHMQTYTLLTKQWLTKR
jgi:hypothetical protein